MAGAGKASEGTGAPGEATVVDHRGRDFERRRRNEEIPTLREVVVHDTLSSLAIPEKDEVLPCARANKGTGTHTDDAYSAILDQNWTVEEEVGGNGCGGNGGGCGGGDDEVTGVAGDVHCPNCTNASSAPSPARLALGGSDTGTANDRKRRGTPKGTGDGTGHLWAM